MSFILCLNQPFTLIVQKHRIVWEQIVWLAYEIAYHSYADDTQIYLALSPNDYSPIDSLC